MTSLFTTPASPLPHETVLQTLVCFDIIVPTPYPVAGWGGERGWETSVTCTTPSCYQGHTFRPLICLGKLCWSRCRDVSSLENMSVKYIEFPDTPYLGGWVGWVGVIIHPISSNGKGGGGVLYSTIKCMQYVLRSVSDCNSEFVW